MTQRMPPFITTIGEAGTGGEHLDADFAGARVGDGWLFNQLQDLGTAEPGDTNVLPGHGLTIGLKSPRVTFADNVPAPGFPRDP